MNRIHDKFNKMKTGADSIGNQSITRKCEKVTISADRYRWRLNYTAQKSQAPSSVYHYRMQKSTL